MSKLTVTAKINLEEIEEVLQHLRDTDNEGDVVCLMHPITKGHHQALTSDDLHLWLCTLLEALAFAQYTFNALDHVEGSTLEGDQTIEAIQIKACKLGATSEATGKKGYINDLSKAGALIAAEIDRIDRLEGNQDGIDESLSQIEALGDKFKESFGAAESHMARMAEGMRVGTASDPLVPGGIDRSHERQKGLDDPDRRLDECVDEDGNVIARQDDPEKAPTNLFSALRDATGDEFDGVDAAGEVLEVGDLVEQYDVVHIITDIEHPIQTHLALRIPPDTVTKLTTLTHEQYLPLARRTLDPDMTETERISEHALGLVEEMREFEAALERGDEAEILEEAGDVCWYSAMLLDVINGDYKYWDKYEPPAVEDFPDWDSPDWLSIIKKAAHQKRPAFIGVLGSAATIAGGRVLCAVEKLGTTLGEIRYQNIRKLMERYPDGFVAKGGNR